jgi:hypothetical protein
MVAEVAADDCQRLVVLIPQSQYAAPKEGKEPPCLPQNSTQCNATGGVPGRARPAWHQAHARWLRHRVQAHKSPAIRCQTQRGGLPRSTAASHRRKSQSPEPPAKRLPFPDEKNAPPPDFCRHIHVRQRRPCARSRPPSASSTKLRSDTPVRLHNQASKVENRPAHPLLPRPQVPEDFPPFPVANSTRNHRNRGVHFPGPPPAAVPGDCTPAWDQREKYGECPKHPVLGLKTSCHGNPGHPHGFLPQSGLQKLVQQPCLEGCKIGFFPKVPDRVMIGCSHGLSAPSCCADFAVIKPLHRKAQGSKGASGAGLEDNGGEGGIRTLGSLLDYGALAKRCFRPLSHLTGNRMEIIHAAGLLVNGGFQGNQGGWEIVRARA